MRASPSPQDRLCADSFLLGSVLQLRANLRRENLSSSWHTDSPNAGAPEALSTPHVRGTGTHGDGPSVASQPHAGTRGEMSAGD